MLYREQNENSRQYKQNYLDGIERIISQRQAEAAEKREIFARDILSDGERYRADFKKMLGWPLVDHAPEGKPNVICEKLSDEDTFEVFRMQFEVLDGLFLTGLLIKQKSDECLPLVIVQHGGGGSPELVAGFYGTTSNYHNMLGGVISRDCHAFLPQLYVWGEGYGVKYDRISHDAQLKRLGSSITAIEIFGITRVLDYFESEPYVKNFGMLGLSYGGFYTLFTAACDTRIRSALTCAQFSSRDAYPWPDWVWQNAAFSFDDAEIACLVYPRKLYITVGERDDLFDYRFAAESFEKLKKICGDDRSVWLEFQTFDGIHEFLRDDGLVERMISDLK